MNSSVAATPRPVGWAALACAAFASMVSMRVCDAMLPALARDFDARPAEAASAISGFALAYGLMQLVYGPLGDRFGKTRVISLAAAGCALAALLVACATSLGSLISGRVLMGAFAAGIIPLTMAWIGDRVAIEGRQEALAGLLTWTVLGMMLGTWAGGALAQAGAWRLAFVLLCVLFALAAFGVARVSRGDRGPDPTGLTVGYAQQIRALCRSAWTRRLLAVVFLEGACVFGSLAFVPTALHDRFQLTLAEAGGVVVFFGVGGMAYSRLAGRWVRRWGAPRLSSMGGVFVGLALALLAIAPVWMLAVPACWLAGLGFYMLHNTLQTCATQLSATARGTGVSIFVAALFLGQSFGIAVASLVVDRLSSSAWFASASPIMLWLGCWFGRCLRRRQALGEARG